MGQFGPFLCASIPLPARGGIRAHSRIGEFATSWWGRRWIQTLESFQVRSRLNRGRSYARRGQVLHLEIANHKVTATVQGSSPIPYNVTIELRRIPIAQWRKVGKAMASKVAIAARLMAGALPPEAEECFAEAGVALFPTRDADLITSCDCPDFSNPCKHIAAVYYLLAEQFDRGPFLLFRLRGMGREQFVAMLGKGENSPARRQLGGQQIRTGACDPRSGGECGSFLARASVSRRPLRTGGALGRAGAGGAAAGKLPLLARQTRFPGGDVRPVEQRRRARPHRPREIRRPRRAALAVTPLVRLAPGECGPRRSPTPDQRRESSRKGN
jgi:uncharacterized Zn finger protein